MAAARMTMMAPPVSGRAERDQGLEIKKRHAIVLALVLVAVGLTTFVQSALGPALPQRLARDAPAPATPVAAATQKEALAAYDKLPLAFVPNAGQTDARVRYQAQAGGANFYFTRRAAVFSFAKKEQGVTLRLSFLGASPTTRIEGERLGPGRVNYLIGNDPAMWQTGLPTYGQIVYRNLWPGIDMVFRGGKGRLSYEFLVRPGARPEAIRLAYHGAQGLRLDPSGNLRIRTQLGVLTDPRPMTYQVVAGRRTPVASRIVLSPSGAHGFALGSYDRSRPLVIDPGLLYSTYLGGSSFDGGFGITLDGAGNAYVTGRTVSADFPTTAGAFDTTYNGGDDAFVTKLNALGTGLLYSTYLGGSNFDEGLGIAVDGAGNAYVTGDTGSADFPTTAGAFATTGSGVNAFVTKLSALGTALLYSTYLGGSSTDAGFAIAVDGAGNAYLTGTTRSADFPTTAAFDTTLGGAGDAFVTKLNALGTGLVYSTYLGGSSGENGFGIALDGAGSTDVTGNTDSTDFPTTAGAFDTTLGGSEDVFVTKLDASGSGPLVYSTYLGGSSSDEGRAIAVDGVGNAGVTGVTDSTDFPTTAGAFDTTYNGGGDAFTTKLNALGAGLLGSTYVGGSGSDEGLGIALDGAASVYLTGDTGSADFPTSAGAFDTSFNGGGRDSFVTKLNAKATGLLYSTYLGGSSFEAGFGIAVDGAGNAYAAGSTGSADFPTTAGAFDTTFNGGLADAFVTKLAPQVSPADEINELIGTVQGLGLSQGITNSLVVKLQAALTAGDTKTACNNLDAFINEVQAQSGKKIPTAAASDLIATAEQIKQDLGC
jgi:hypothetical protein